MEKIKSFKNASEFQEIFGLTAFGHRKNKLLLSLLKSKELWKRKNEFRSLFRKVVLLKSQQGLYDLIVEDIAWGYHDRGDKYLYLPILPAVRNNRYKTDNYSGVCEDGDTSKIRVLVPKSGQPNELVVRKTSPGKVLRQVIKDSEMRWLPETVVNFLCEQFAEKWRCYCSEKYSNLTLIVNDRFDKIYDSRWLNGDFGSCMTDVQGCVEFYSECGKFSAAYLKNEDDLIVARCVIFNEVFIEGSDNPIRLAERQYTRNSSGDNTLKRLLVKKLIDGGYIEGYKSVGAGCHSPHDFMWNDGSTLSDDMWIRCTPEEFAPYMDSFKWYKDSEHKAYNYAKRGYTHRLEETDGYLPGEEYCEVLCDGECHEVTRDEREENYVWDCDIEEYVHRDDYVSCAQCGNIVLNELYCDRTDNAAHYSEILEEYFCCEECRDDAVYSFVLDCIENGELENIPQSKWGEVVIINDTELKVTEEIYNAIHWSRLSDFKENEDGVLSYKEFVEADA